MKSKGRTIFSVQVMTAMLIAWGGGTTPVRAQLPDDWDDHDLTVGGDPVPSSICEIGTCDDATVRNAWIPGGTEPKLTIRIKFNIFPDILTISSGRVQAELDDISEDFLLSRIDFQNAPTEWITDPQYNQIDSLAESNAMKTAHADQPGIQLNVYVTDLGPGLPGARAFANFPWDPDATGTTGGIVIDKEFFGRGPTGPSSLPANTGILTHEIGHALGLWHTFHGSSKGELEAAEHGDCGGGIDGCDCACYETANRTSEEGDSTGDMCSDTVGRDVWQACDSHVNVDLCSGANWNSSIDSNYMSLQNDGTCRSHFTAQQRGRTRCWSCENLGGWIVGEGAPGACCLPDGSCQIVGQTCCTDRGGSFLAGGTCGIAACCLGGGSCATDSEVCCIGAGGTFLAGTTDCQTDCDGSDPTPSNVCQITNACCLADGSCIETTLACCSAQYPSLFCGGCSDACNTPFFECPAWGPE